MKRTIAIALLCLAATLGAISYTYAHLDYRDRIEYLTRVATGKLILGQPPNDNLIHAIIYGIPAVSIAAVAIGMIFFELRIFRRVDS